VKENAPEVLERSMEIVVLLAHDCSDQQRFEKVLTELLNGIVKSGGGKEWKGNPE
jgi:hypothetical protein